MSKVPLEKLYDKRVIAVNDAYKLYQWDCMYFKDHGWFHRYAFKEGNDVRTNEDLLRSFGGLKVTTCDKLIGKPGIKVCRRGQRTGIEMGPDALTHGSSSGQEAICLAVRFGTSRIILLGFDMKMVDGRHNWHSDHIREIPNNIYETQFIKRLEETNLAAQKLGIEIINCTEGSNLKEFPIKPLEEFV